MSWLEHVTWMRVKINAYIILLGKSEGKVIFGRPGDGGGGDEGKAIPAKAWTGPEVSKRKRLPKYQDSRYMNVVRLSALQTGRLYTPGDIRGTRFFQRPSRLKGQIPMTQSENEPATFRLVARCLNQNRHRVPRAEGRRY